MIKDLLKLCEILVTKEVKTIEITIGEYLEDEKLKSLYGYGDRVKRHINTEVKSRVDSHISDSTGDNLKRKMYDTLKIELEISHSISLKGFNKIDKLDIDIKETGRILEYEGDVDTEIVDNKYFAKLGDNKSLFRLYSTFAIDRDMYYKIVYSEQEDNLVYDYTIINAHKVKNKVEI